MGNNIDWFKRAKYGLFIHFGLYSFFEGEYKGERSSNYAEWIQSYFRISNSEMEKVASVFNPRNLDVGEWVRFAASNGFKYIIFTAKHHDGFAMFDSKINDYNITNTPLNRDILKELAIECNNHNIKLGVYYSQDLDWHEKDGGGYNTINDDCAGTSWSNNWDFSDNDKNFDNYFYGKCLPQIKEIMTNYGEIAIAWFDIPFTLSKKQSQEVWDLVKKCQPNCLINSRLGNGIYDYVSFGDNEIPESEEELKNINSKDNDINGIKESKYGLYEVCQTLNQSWGYTKFAKWKEIDTLKLNKQKAENCGANFLVNIGPNREGEFPVEAENLIKEIMSK